MVAIGLVASDFYLEGCVDECRYWLGDASCGGAADMARFLKSVPEHFYGHEAFDVMMDFASVTGDWFDEASPLHDEFEDSAFLVEPKVFASIEEADREGLLTLRPQLLDLPPYAWAFLVRTAVRGRGLLHGIYMAVRCYLDQSPHCRDLDEAGKKGVFRQVLEGGPLEKLFVINVFLDAVLHSCPYIELVLPLPSLRKRSFRRRTRPLSTGRLRPSCTGATCTGSGTRRGSYTAWASSQGCPSSSTWAAATTGASGWASTRSCRTRRRLSDRRPSTW